MSQSLDFYGCVWLIVYNCVCVCLCLIICVCVCHCPQVLESVLGIGCVFLGISVSEKFGGSFVHKAIAKS